MTNKKPKIQIIHLTHNKKKEYITLIILHKQNYTLTLK